MEKKYLVQRRDNYDNDVFGSLMTAGELIHYINMNDCIDESYRIFDISDFGTIKQLYYVGWQPDCLIEVEDEFGKIVISGYGVDH